jgi:hypothetical protein
MLDSLRPNRAGETDDEDDEFEDGIEHHDQEHEHEHSVRSNEATPQFVLAPEVDELGEHGRVGQPRADAQPRASTEGKGWKEVV